MAEEQKFFFLDLKTAAGILGGCKKQETKDWLELDSWNFSMTQTADANTKGGGSTGTPATGRFSFSIKHNGPALFKHVSTGTHLTKPVTFRAYRGGLISAGGAPGTQTTTKYFELVFTGTVVSGRSISGDDGIKDENIELVFHICQMTYWQIVNGAVVSGAGLQKIYNPKSMFAK